MPTLTYYGHSKPFPPIEQDPDQFRRKVGDRARVEVMNPGDELNLG